MLDADTLAAVIGGVVAFLVVAGWAVLRWRAVGRDPTYHDDDSVLLAAPPPGMTAATATVIDGRPSQLALTAGLLDLASRDEIAFRDEDPAAHGNHPIGIEIRGGTSDDPRIRLNRRRPVGDGEAWLLTMLKETIVEQAAHGGSIDDRPDMQMNAMTAMLGFFGFEGTAAMSGQSDGPGGAFVGGMTAGIPDFDTLMAGMESRSGKPVSDKTRASLGRMAPILEALRDPESIGDPDAFIDRMAASTGKQPTPEERSQYKSWIAQLVAARQRPTGQAAPAACSGRSGHGRTGHGCRTLDRGGAVQRRRGSRPRSSGSSRGCLGGAGSGGRPALPGGGSGGDVPPAARASVRSSRRTPNGTAGSPRCR